MAKKKKDKGTLVCFLLDSTGSMLQVKEETIIGFNQYVDKLKEQRGVKMLLTKFNSIYIDVGTPVSINKIDHLTAETYIPDNATPLYDAIGRTIKEASENEDGQKVVVTIMTDGLENASREYTKDGIFQLIESKKKAGWQFVFLGANQDAYAVGGGLGISRAGTHTYDQTRTVQTFAAAAAATTRYAEGSDEHLSFTDEEKEEME